MPTRLVSILGLGPEPEPPHYHPVAYHRDGDAAPSSPTPLVQRALLDLDPAITSVVLLGTARVRERWIATGRAAELLGAVPLAFIDIPDGATAEDRWTIFHTVARALRPSAIAGIEDTAPDAIVFDVTHGFRLQPMLGLAALSFVRSEAVRGDFPPTPIRVTYGAWEARDQATQVAPIWDLTELLVAADWNAAFDALLRHNRADALHRLATDTARAEQAADPAAANALERLADAALRFADDLATSRTAHILRKSATDLQRALLTGALARWRRRLPILESPLEALRERVAKLHAPKLISPAGLRAQAALVADQFTTGQFANAVVGIREGLTDLGALLLGRAGSVEPSSHATTDARRSVDNALHVDDGHFPEGSPLEAVARMRHRFTKVRNDILHGGRNRPDEAPHLRDQLRQEIDAFKALVDHATR